MRFSYRRACLVCFISMFGFMSNSNLQSFIPQYLALLLLYIHLYGYKSSMITQRHGLNYINRDYHASMLSVKVKTLKEFRYKVHTILVCRLSILPCFLFYLCFSLIHKSCFCGPLLVVLYMVSTLVSYSSLLKKPLVVLWIHCLSAGL